MEMLRPEIYRSNNYVTLDFETDTSHGDYGHPVHKANSILLACYTLGPEHPGGAGETFSVWGGEFEQAHLLRVIEQADFVVAHQAKYELGWLRRCGLDLGEVMVWDTRLAECVMMGNLHVDPHRRSLSLDACCIRRGWAQKDPVVDHLIKSGVNPVFIPRSWLQGRCEQDVHDTHRLFLSQRERIVEHQPRLLNVLYARCLLTPVLADIEFNGMCLDSERVREGHISYTQRYQKLSARIDEITGGINWNSSKQVGAFIYGELGFVELSTKKGKLLRTATDQPKTDKDTLLALKAVTEQQKEFIKIYSEINKLGHALNNSLGFFRGVVEEQDGIFYAEFNQANTATHRLSSSGMGISFKMYDGEIRRAQFQNLPSAFKPMFKAREPGWLLCESDGSGLEFRGAGILSQDAMILHDINTGRDPHAYSGAVIHQMDYEEFIEGKKAGDTKILKWRKDAKEHTFKPLFGGKSGTSSERRYYDAFNERYSGLVSVQDTWVEQVMERGYLETPWGMRFYFPQASRGPDGYVNVRTVVFNYPIQSISTAEIIPLVLVAFWHLVRASEYRDRIMIVNTVHDSIVSEVHPDALEEYKKLSVKAWHFVYKFFRVVYDYPLVGIPLGTEIVFGTHWSEGDSVAFNVWDNGKEEIAQ